MATYIDLFAGPGGLCTGFKNSGFVPLIAVEKSDNTVLTYARNNDAEIYELQLLLNNKGNLENIIKPTEKTCLIHGDIRMVDNELILEVLRKKFDTDRVDVVAGGPPCESFSLAGTRTEGDERDNLFENMLRIANAVQSKFVFFENVPGLLSKLRKGKKIFNLIKNEFLKHGYILASTDVKEIKLLAADYGVPQNRERIFLVGCNNRYGDNPFIYPEKTHGPGRKFNYLTSGEALRYLPTIQSGQGNEIMDYEYDYEEDFKNNIISRELYNYMKFISGNHGYLPEKLKKTWDKSYITMHKSVNHRLNMVKRMENIKQGEGMKKAAERLISEGKEDIVKKYFPKKLYSSRNRRLRLDEPSFTVTSHCLDEIVHPISNRGLTPREAARLQSFPDWYYFEGEYVKFHGDALQDKYEQCGDAIPVLLVKAIADQLRIALEELDSRNLEHIVIV